MKPLVYWCRWHEARLRLRGRDGESVWGELAFADETVRFHYNLTQALLSIETGLRAGVRRLDEMGVERDA